MNLYEKYGVKMSLDFQYTESNHFKYFYNNVAYSNRKKACDVFSTSHGKIHSPPMNWRDECIRAAHTIWDLHGSDLVLFFSGGLDSEVMFRSFVALGCKPRVAIIRFHNLLNCHDIQFATQACSQLGIEPIYLDIDVEKFWENEIFSYTDGIQLTSPQLAVLLWAIDQVDGVPCIGAGENFLQRNYGEDLFFDVESENSVGLYQWFIKNNNPGIPAFFQYTPEQMYSFLIDENTQRLLKNSKNRRFLSTSKVKYELYRHHFDLAPRAAMTGFELVMEHDRIIRTTLEERYNRTDSLFKTPLNKYLNEFLPEEST